nr:MAG TPA: hypothetical protein [Caudoviricetes sp.]
MRFLRLSRPNPNKEKAARQGGRAPALLFFR